MNMKNRHPQAARCGLGLGLLAAALLSACASKAPAPVIERAAPVAFPGEAAQRSEPRSEPLSVPLGPDMYVVKKGDTLRAIALDHGQSYRDIAAWNGLADPNKIEVGQALRVAPPGAAPVSTAAGAEPVAVAKPVNMSGAVEPAVAAAPPAAAPVASAAAGDMLKRGPKGGKLPYSPEALEKLQKRELPVAAPAPAAAAATVAAAGAAATAVATAPAEKTPPAAPPPDNVDWAWPAGGKLLGGFVEGSKGQDNKGVDIAGKTGEPVLAAAAGKVILVSSALRGYGNFVIIKHNNTFLSVYAHNSRILVKEEQTVSKGQKIAEIGSSDADQSKLHFEIRRQGKPVDPAKFLPAR